MKGTEKGISEPEDSNRTYPICKNIESIEWKKCEWEPVGPYRDVTLVPVESWKERRKAVGLKKYSKK